jgi:hypothetical protein
MVLWTIALLAAVTILLAGIIEGWITEETREGKQFKARQQALSGIAIALNSAVQPGDPLLRYHSHDRSEGYTVLIKDESGLINPNALLAVAPDQRALLAHLFTAWGLSKDQSDTAADGLYDWQSTSPFRSLHGAKQSDYASLGRGGLPPDAPFNSPDEMALVIGFDPVMQAKPDWISYFTTYYNGKINVLHAPKGVLTDLIGLTPVQADQWIQLRNGKDGIEGTSDDLVVDTIDHAADLMGASAAQRSLLLSVCGVAGSVRRIESTGIFNGVSHRITIITSGGSTDNAQASGNLLGWSEQ